MITKKQQTARQRKPLVDLEAVLAKLWAEHKFPNVNKVIKQDDGIVKLYHDDDFIGICSEETYNEIMKKATEWAKNGGKQKTDN